MEGLSDSGWHADAPSSVASIGRDQSAGNDHMSYLQSPESTALGEHDGVPFFTATNARNSPIGGYLCEGGDLVAPLVGVVPGGTYLAGYAVSGAEQSDVVRLKPVYTSRLDASLAAITRARFEARRLGSTSLDFSAEVVTSSESNMLVRIANANRALMIDSSGPVQRILDASDIVIVIWREPEGIGRIQIKGMGTDVLNGRPVPKGTIAAGRDRNSIRGTSVHWCTCREAAQIAWEFFSWDDANPVPAD
jgi:hypothetical protein